MAASRSLQLLGPPLVGDVPADLGGPDDLALGVADRRDGERDVDDGAVLPPPLRLVVVDLLAAADAAEDALGVLDGLGRHEHGDVPADDLLGGVAEDAFRPLVPARDDAVEVLRGDDVVGGLDDGGELLVQQLRPPLLGDVAEDEDDARDPALIVLDGGRTVVDRAFPPVAADEHGVVGEADGLAGGQDLLDGVLDGPPGQLVDDGEDLGQSLAVGLGVGPAREGLGDGVQEEDTPLVVGGDDGITDAGEGRREPTLVEG